MKSFVELKLVDQIFTLIYCALYSVLQLKYTLLLHLSLVPVIIPSHQMLSIIHAFLPPYAIYPFLPPYAIYPFLPPYAVHPFLPP